MDSEVMMGFLSSSGFRMALHPGQADVIVINTCGFVESAAHESIEVILDMVGLKETGSCKGIVVAGCLYQRYGEKLRKEMPEADSFIGCGELGRISEACRRALGAEKFASRGQPAFLYDHNTPRTLLNAGCSAYVKIAEGCDNRCSYCTIPGIRGAYRSRSAESVVKEVRSLVLKGIKEINLIAQDTTYFGVPEAGKEELTHLLRELDAVRGRKWVRLLYAHPGRITTAVARSIGDSRSICHYVDMPIQHICDDILKSMRRKGSSDDIRKSIDTLRKEVPDIAVRTTLMVGYPGETDEHFEELLRFASETKFDRLGVFKYSREPGTPAARLRNRIPEDVKEERYEALMREQLIISRRLNRSLVGRRMDALVEGIDEEAPNTLLARTYRDAPEVDGFVRVPCESSPPVGEFVHVEITKAHDYDLEGRLL
ncbi:MAG: 30S ribosomal protein S12 methylthiotransferase RimO [Candidatus Lindowbacteria bacterium]|nr:30S ribosomal protein S12 methylthiotransferase RimO [Candidatus Lindowbacteria bacterium]